MSLNMETVGEVQVHIKEQSGARNPIPPDTNTDKHRTETRNQPRSMLKHWKWWLILSLCTISVLAGQTIATLLGRLYYNDGGASLWMATLVQSAGSPLLLLPFLLLRRKSSPHPLTAKLVSIYLGLGLLVGADNLMYSYGLLYLPVSTYSLVCATQLAFNALFSYFLNSQKFTPLVLNSVVLLSFSAALLGVGSGSESSASPRGKYAIGFLLTLSASATYSLILSLMQRTFQRVVRRESFFAVLEMQLYTNVAAALTSLLGLFASGDWGRTAQEMEGFAKGRAAYVAVLAGIALAWQVCAVGVIGLIFIVSSLFSNVISTLALPVVPVFAVVFFHDRMDGVKVVAMLIAIWGFLSYMYQHYADDLEKKKGEKVDVL